MIRRIVKIAILLASIVAMTTGYADAQSEAGRLSIGFNAGMNKYWGSFTDNQVFFSGEAFSRINILSWLSFHGNAGLGQIRYTNTAFQQTNYPEYFKKFTGTIPAKSFIRTVSYEGLLSINFFPNETLVPYLFGGIGVLDFNPVQDNSNISLPNNANNVYKKRVMTTPFGIGFEMYVSDNVVFNMKAAYYLGVSEWLDDLDSVKASNGSYSTAKDDYATVGLGFSYYILGDADLDDDGLSNSRERTIGTDPQNPDSDGDGLTDGNEVIRLHSDPLKLDSDGDGLGDGDEVNKYGSSPIHLDTDNDGLNDGEEISRKTNPKIADSDQDGLLDGDEVNRYKTDALSIDSDKDELNDGDEVKAYQTDPAKTDTDGDGLSDGNEVHKFKTSPKSTDTDGDALTDGLEVNQYKSDPIKIDSDTDGLSDGEEVNTHKTNPIKTDTDADGLNDGDEVKKYSTNPNKIDSDGDVLSDYDEILNHKTDPIKKDSDDDGLNDGEEVTQYRTDPLKSDTDGDTIKDGDEVTGKHPLTPGERTNPAKADTDSDGVNDAQDFCPNIQGTATSPKKGCPDIPKIGTKVDFPEILFIVNTDQFNYDNVSTAASLAKLLSYVNQCPKLEVMLEGHASSEGPKKRNQELSNMRAQRVKSWLIEQGVNSNKIQGTIGFGSSRPKVQEPTGKAGAEALEAARKLNRRITVVVVKTCDS